MRRVCVVLLCALSCCNCKQPVNPPVDWPPQVDWDEFGATHCPSQCVQLAVLQCPESKPTPSGISCADSCRVLLERRVWTPQDVACVEAAATVESVRKCKVRCGSDTMR